MPGEMLLTLFLLAFQLNRFVVGDPRATQAALICSNRTAASSDRQAFVPNFLAAMAALTPQIAERGYGVTTNGAGNNTVHASGECMKDLSRRDCNLCVAQCKTQILRCLPFQRLTKGGRLIYDGCYLRYDDYMFFNEILSSVDKTVCGGDDFLGNQTLFWHNVVDLVRNAGVEGPKNDGFFTGSVINGNLTVYGLAQCWEFVNGSNCVKCLQNAVSRVVSCIPKVEGRALNTGCYLRYSTTKFYNNSENDASSGSGGESRRKAIIVTSTCGGVAFLLFIAMVSLFVRKKALQRKQVKKKLGAMMRVINKSKINFSYESLERATNYFHESNKLGQGGSGSVYKGILSNGQTVAVKRLFFVTTQWVDHFFNEVNLISGIEHTNLVKLLGCSVTGPESLLVYEYVPNQSLHEYLFVRKYVLKMGWEERFKIVLGTAEGLAFLHEKSNPRIIHRDIKLSNILLDNDFTPKIADFGLARMFPEDDSHVSTAVAGTLGYMAPEYMARGKLTEKADVYSYGVLVIEVITGTRNSMSSSQSLHSILHRVWNLNKSGKLAEAVDPKMKGKFPEERAIRVLQIGLVCVQAAADLRPSMSAVVAMLSNDDEDIPKSTQPPYLNANNSAQISGLNIKPRVEIPSLPDSNTESSCKEITESSLEPR